MRTKPELKCTRDYSLFALHEFNRPLHDDPVLFASMKEHGWMPSSPAQVVPNGDGKLKVVRGHHRLDIAKRLKLAVWYVIDETIADPWELEGSCRSAWSGEDFAIARAAAGNPRFHGARGIEEEARGAPIATKRELAGMKRSIGLLVDRLVLRRVQPNPTLAKPPIAREETRLYTKADLLRRWLRRGERRTAEGEAAKLILEMPAPVESLHRIVLATVQATHERIDRMELRQNAVLASLLELEAVSEPEPEPEAA